ncbi:MAG TPA: MFS transporter [Amycolatopsis sp.]|nr:MFS transporter [Amycolatopsis sp.]
MLDNEATAAAATSAATVPRRVAWLTIALLFAGWIVNYIDTFTITVALPSIGQTLTLDKTQQGLVLTVFFFTYTLCQIPGGMLADRIGSRRALTLALIAWAVFTALTGLVSNYSLLLVVRGLYGIAAAMFPGAVAKAISERTSPAQRMTANGVVLTANAIGSGLAPLVAAPTILAIGWRHSFVAVAGLGIVMAALIWFLLPRPKVSAGGDETATAGGPAVRLGRVLRSPAIWLCGLAFFGFDLVGWGLISWAPSYLLDSRGIGLAQTGVLVAIPWFIAAASTVIGGVLFDRYFHDKPRLLIVPSMVATAVLLWFMLNASSTGAFVTFESIAMAFMWLSFMPIFGLPLRLLRGQVAGLANSTVNFGGQVAGTLAPIAMGWLAQQYSFGAAFALLLAGAAVGALASIWIPQRPADFASTLPAEALASAE